MTTGIYTLSFTGTDKVYIGQSIDIENRYKSHCTALRCGKSTTKLQEAFNTYGLPSLTILLECSIDELDTNEELAIEIYNSAEGGFNTMYSSGHRSTLRGELAGNSKYTNELIIAVFMELVCSSKTHAAIEKEYGISRGALGDISRGASHKWLRDAYPDEYNILLDKVKTRRSESLTSKLGGAKTINKYPSVLSPDGQIYQVVLLRAFCREHNLNHGSFGTMLRSGKGSHKGWTIA